MQVVVEASEKAIQRTGLMTPSDLPLRPYVPQLELMKHVDAVPCHGGHSTVTEALYFGVPAISGSSTPCAKRGGAYGESLFSLRVLATCGRVTS